MTEFMSFQPLVTVYMPTYSRVELLQRAVDSVLTQDYKNIELIVVDDKSTDSTHEYLAKTAKEDSRFKYFINEKNSGACVSRNKAIFAATGEFITGLDDDDYFLPHHISSLVESWYRKSESCIAVYPNNYLKTQTQIKKGPKKLSECKESFLISSNWIGNQVLTKTEYMQEIGGFNIDMPAWQDLDCWYTLLKHYDATATSTNDYSYVTDISHTHERISSKNINIILDAYETLVRNHNLTYNEMRILRVQLASYMGKQPPIDSIVRNFFKTPKKENFKYSLFFLALPLMKIMNKFNVDI